ncbi:(2Fe-2S)-binding protein [Pseudomonas sp. LTJR-52]|uniref:(2Fe-2S)-binding protein n=1 Tax=Pseudomonas sp. LTJR-52 TaxID=2479392 RepID=UPI000EFA826A|nr:(2Fe-2S)-binding protein [Pseudomonas sp. LTJR-52]AYN96780.1 (2Fe-2S)-binding protein [Pseudomonas sp. LTJR-52]
MTARFKRLGEADRTHVTIRIDGQAVQALEGDTLMVAVLTARNALRRSEFGDGRRAGFCLMGACQDCWIWTESGERLRACGTPVREGLAVLTEQPEVTWNRV